MTKTELLKELNKGQKKYNWYAVMTDTEEIIHCYDGVCRNTGVYVDDSRALEKLKV